MLVVRAVVEVELVVCLGFFILRPFDLVGLLAPRFLLAVRTLLLCLKHCGLASVHKVGAVLAYRPISLVLVICRYLILSQRSIQSLPRDDERLRLRGLDNFSLKPSRVWNYLEHRLRVRVLFVPERECCVIERQLLALLEVVVFVAEDHLVDLLLFLFVVAFLFAA